MGFFQPSFHNENLAFSFVLALDEQDLGISPVRNNVCLAHKKPGTFIHGDFFIITATHGTLMGKAPLYIEWPTGSSIFDSRHFLDIKYRYLPTGEEIKATIFKCYQNDSFCGYGIKASQGLLTIQTEIHSYLPECIASVEENDATLRLVTEKLKIYYLNFDGTQGCGNYLFLTIDAMCYDYDGDHDQLDIYTRLGCFYFNVAFAHCDDRIENAFDADLVSFNRYEDPRRYT